MLQILWPGGRREGQAFWGVIAPHQATFCWTLILGSMTMNVLLGAHWLPGSF